MPAAKLKQFLDSNQVKYTSITHSVAYTAPEIAALTHVSGKMMAKTVMVLIDGYLAMAVLPASMHVSLMRLKQMTGGSEVRIATEAEFRAAFPDCETGAMPPFGNIYGIPVYVDDTLRPSKSSAGAEIVFNAGTHRELVRLSYHDFERLVQPMVGAFAAELYEYAAM